MILFGLIISASLTVIVILVANLWQSGQHSVFVKKRLANALDRDKKETPEEVARSPLTEVMSKQLEVFINKFVPNNITKELKKKINISKIKNFSVAQYFLLKIIIALFILIFIPLYFSLLKIQINFGLIALLLIVGLVLPDMAIKSKIDKRYKGITKELPGYIDLLRVCIEAGMDLEGGLSKIVEKGSGDLREETAQTFGEIKMGKPLAESLKDMSERISLADFSSFVTLLLQANQMGISISTILKTQSQQVNVKYIQEMRARAAKVPVLIMIPLVFFILPALLVVIIGPAIIQIINIL